ncbi:PAS domain-containing protein [Halorubrum cibi]|uniref:histidine kinase n=1 Tax=Halorubrum cibi TaxID=413815 RepID=A0A521D754_9EURY|nr:PAS domain-containing protein [Halorubrum cibi]SMO67528.1 PAS domain S-box-containing protein [Halorubrum cibi]
MTGPIQVLHVDDDPAFADLAAEFLEREGDRLNVRTETSPENALEPVREDDVDCVVSDHDMPEMDGIELLEAVRDERSEIPFVLFTGKGSEEIASEAVSAGVTDYLQKEGGTDQYTLLANRIENAVERYRSQRAVERGKRRFEAIFDNTYQFTGLLDPDGTILEANEAALSFADTERDAVVGDPLWEGPWFESSPDARESAREGVEAARNGDLYREEIAIHGVDGEAIVDFSVRPVTNEEGEVILLIPEGRDITELKDRKAALRRKERRFEAIFDDPNLLVGLLEPDGTIVDVNDTALGYVDVDREDLVGRPFSEAPWWTDEYREAVEGWIDRAADGEYVEYDAVHPTDDGGSVTVEGTFRPVTDADGSATRIVVSAKDVSERERRTRQLERRTRELKRRNERFDEFASFVSHDLQGPVSTVRGRLDLALDTGEMEHVEHARRAMERVDHLRRDLVDTLRTGEVVSTVESADLDALFETVWTAIDPPESASYTVDDASVEADVDALRRLLENVVRNSIEHGNDDVEVRFGAFDRGIFYEDDGPGIAPEHRDHVFTPGFSTKSGEEGIGMGMASVRQIVLAHGWEIEIDEAAELAGVRFEIVTE